MPRWGDVEAGAPELAALARGLFDAHVNKTLATLRRDGSPRISGIEVDFTDGDLWFGSMWQALKARDLQRDPRFALHSGSSDPPAWKGDAKVSGRALEIDDPGIKAAHGSGAPPGPFHLFRADIQEVVVVYVGDPADHIVVDSWHPGRGLARRERR